MEIPDWESLVLRDNHNNAILSIDYRINNVEIKREFNILMGHLSYLVETNKVKEVRSLREAAEGM